MKLPLMIAIALLAFATASDHLTIYAASPQNTVGLSVFPGIVEVALARDKTFARPVTLTNNGASPLQVSVEVAGFVDPGDNSFVLGQPHIFKATDLASVNVSQVVIPAKSAKTVNIQFAPSGDYVPGSYFASLRIAQVGHTGGNISQVAAIAVPIFMHVPGRVARDITLSSPTSKHVSVSDSLSLPLNFYNPSASQAAIWGLVELRNSRGELLRKEHIPYTAILPTLRKNVKVPLNVTQTGMYTANIKYVVGGTAKTASIKVYFVGRSVVATTIMTLKIAFGFVLVIFIMRIASKIKRKHHKSHSPKI